MFFGAISHKLPLLSCLKRIHAFRYAGRYRLRYRFAGGADTIRLVSMRATTIRFGEDLWEMLEREAAEQGVSTAQLIREAAIMRVAALAAHRGDDRLEIPLQELADRALARRQGASTGRDADLHDPERLEAVRRTGLLVDANDPTLDRLTNMARMVVEAPVALISLIEADRQVFASSPGLGEPWATRGETPLSYAICTHAIAYREPLVLNDVRLHQGLSNSPAVTELEVVAYLGIPLITDRGHVLGALCAIDHKPRDWSEEQVELVKTLARAVMDHIELETAVRT